MKRFAQWLSMKNHTIRLLKERNEKLRRRIMELELRASLRGDL